MVRRTGKEVSISTVYLFLCWIKKRTATYCHPFSQINLIDTRYSGDVFEKAIELTQSTRM